MHVLKQEYFLFPKEIPLSGQQIKIFYGYVEDLGVRNCCARLDCAEQERTIILYMPSMSMAVFLDFFKIKILDSKLFM